MKQDDLVLAGPHGRITVPGAVLAAARRRMRAEPARFGPSALPALAHHT